MQCPICSSKRIIIVNNSSLDIACKCETCGCIDFIRKFTIEGRQSKEKRLNIVKIIYKNLYPQIATEVPFEELPTSYFTEDLTKCAKDILDELERF